MGGRNSIRALLAQQVAPLTALLVGRPTFPGPGPGPLAGAVVGGLTAAAAAHLVLPQGLPVAQGGADAFVGMVGLGVLEAGQMALLTGSSHLHLGMTDRT